MALSVCYCLARLGISQLGDWDVLAFVHRHGVNLTSPEQMARLVGHESTVVSDALDRLLSRKFIERSRPSRGVHLYQTIALPDPERTQCLEYLIRSTQSRSGRLQLTKELKSVTPDLAWPKQVADGQAMDMTERSDYA